MFWAVHLVNGSGLTYTLGCRQTYHYVVYNEFHAFSQARGGLRRLFHVVSMLSNAQIGLGEPPCFWWATLGDARRLRRCDMNRI